MPKIVVSLENMHMFTFLFNKRSPFCVWFLLLFWFSCVKVPISEAFCYLKFIIQRNRELKDVDHIVKGKRNRELKKM